MDTVIIRLSRFKLILMLALIGIFVSVAVGALFMAQQADGTAAFVSYLFGIGILLGAVPLFYYYARFLLDPAPGLVIDKDGIDDNSNPLGVGRIPWSQIRKIKTKTYEPPAFGPSRKANFWNPPLGRPTRYLLVHVKDPRAFLQQRKGLSRWLLRQRQRLGGTPITITNAFLSVGFDQLQSTVQEKFEEHRSMNSPKHDVA
jgi:hypothetical protein